MFLVKKIPAAYSKMDKLLGLYRLELMSPLMIGSYTHLTMNNYKEKNKNMRINMVESL